MEKISFIIPCYKSGNELIAVINEIKNTMHNIGKYGFEIILVCDGSPDDTFILISNICHKCDYVKGIDLARNFGQHAAIMAGIQHASGDILVFLDDDGQNPPHEVNILLDAINDGWDVVFGEYDSKQHSFLRNIGSWVNDFMARKLINKPKGLSITSFWACKRYIGEEILKYKGAFPYIAGLIVRSTLRIYNVPITHRQRINGRSGYTFSKLLSLWLNGFTSFSVKPLRIATVCGCVIAAIGLLYAIYLVILRIIHPDMAMGFTSLMAAILVIGGMIMIMLGLIGEYIGRIFMCINSTPQYVVRGKIGFEADDDESS